MRLYVAGPLFSEAERSWLNALPRAYGRRASTASVPHENFTELTDVSVDAVYRIDAEGLRSSNALVAWLDGPIVDDGTACEIGMFAELVRSGGEQYRGIVAISTDIRLERRRQVNVVGGGMNLFVAGAIESCGRICHTVDEVLAALRAERSGHSGPGRAELTTKRGDVCPAVHLVRWRRRMPRGDV